MPFTRWYIGNQALYACGRCGLVYQPNRRDWSEVQISFEKGYYDEHVYMPTTSTRQRQFRVIRLLEMVEPLAGKRVLDVGCGQGEFLAAARARGTEVFGVERSPSAAEVARSQAVDVHIGPFEDWAAGQEPARFDVVTFISVLETMESPSAALTACWRLLSDDGLVMVVTGDRLDYTTFPSSLSRYLGRGFPRELHPYHWSRVSLEAMLNVNGFNVIARDWREAKTLCYLARKCMPYSIEHTVLDSAYRLKWYFIRWHFASYKFRACGPFERGLSMVIRAARRFLPHP
jgi:2-polyprenyl-3-methyl-5-hydroxy-6-metoxy-1,4-benzoquinol methylase